MNVVVANVFASYLRSGRRGRRFESCRSDHLFKHLQLRSPDLARKWLQRPFRRHSIEHSVGEYAPPPWKVGAPPSTRGEIGEREI